MSHFFQPCSKVQKDRHIMRETDSRMAKYSRRGLIFNFIAFLICLIGGNFVSQNPVLTIVLTSGLLFFTLIRGFYLFRFEQLYSRGPRRWRNSYFVATLLGSIWWGLIMASITLVQGLEYETPLLWLYTVVFFSTTAHAFAPYHRFLSYYQFFGLIPAAAAAIIIGGSNGYVYGSLMLMFYLILVHQCRLISDNYWEKLEAGFALGKRVVNDEQERVTYKSNVKLGRAFLASLDRELTLALQQSDASSALHKKIGQLNVELNTFRKVLSKEIKMTGRIFNARHEIQYLVSEFIEQGELNNVPIETSLSPNLPMRLKGDPVRFAQIVRSLIAQVLVNARDVAVLIEVQFLREYEKAGELHVNVRRMRNKESAGEVDTKVKEQSLALVLAKGLAGLMDGDIEQLNTPSYDYQLRFTAKFDIADNTGQLDFHKNRFQGKSILIVGSNPAVVDIKRDEFDSLGFSITTETQFKRVQNLLKSRVQSGQAIESVLVYHEPDNEECGKLLDLMRDADDLKSVTKIIAASERGHSNLAQQGFDETLGFYFISKPLGLFELESTFEYIYLCKGDDDALSKCQNGSIVLIGDEQEEETLREACQLLPGQELFLANRSNLTEVLEKANNPMAVIPCSIDTDVGCLLDIIRNFEAQKNTDDSFIPIIGVGKDCSERDIDAFEVGLDDYLDLSSASSKTLTSMLRYWRSLDL